MYTVYTNTEEQVLKKWPSKQQVQFITIIIIIILIHIILILILIITVLFSVRAFTRLPETDTRRKSFKAQKHFTLA